VAKPVIQFYERVCAAGEFLAFNALAQSEDPGKIHVLLQDFYRLRGRPVMDLVYRGLLGDMADPYHIQMKNRGLHVITFMACYHGGKPASGPFHRNALYRAIPVMVA
jgi:hypothetical protein